MWRGESSPSAVTLRLNTKSSLLLSLLPRRRVINGDLYEGPLEHDGASKVGCRYIAPAAAPALLPPRCSSPRRWLINTNRMHKNTALVRFVRGDNSVWWMIRPGALFWNSSLGFPAETAANTVRPVQTGSECWFSSNHEEEEYFLWMRLCSLRAARVRSSNYDGFKSRQ